MVQFYTTCTIFHKYAFVILYSMRGGAGKGYKYYFMGVMGVESVSAVCAGVYPVLGRL